MAPHLAGSGREDVGRGVQAWGGHRQRSQFRLGRKICVNASRLYSCHVTGVPRSIQRST